MGLYIVRRCLLSLLILALLTFVFFLLFGRLGNLCTRYTAPGQPPALLRACLAAHGLDQPWPVRYWQWVTGLARGDLGTDYGGLPLTSALAQRLPTTMILFGVSYLMQEAIAFALGLLGALKQYSLPDKAATALAYALIAVPNFWLGLLLLVVVGVKLSWLPLGGAIDPAFGVPFGTAAYWGWYLAHPLTASSDLLRHLALPALTLAAAGIGVDGRFVRGSLLDVLAQDYVRTARAKGLPERTVVLKHALRNALLPLITNSGLAIGTAMGGSIIVESIFNWPGMGWYFSWSLQIHDSRTLEILLLVASAIILLTNLAADLVYAWADPRIRYTRGSS